MSTIADIKNPWRQLLLTQEASFRGIMFHVESGSRNSGRRTVTHEYPKRDDPYAEDMGRHARRWQFSGYLIYRPNNSHYQMGSYVLQRKRLIDALEKEDADKLVHPVFAPGGILAMCERYTMTESREKGGYTQFEMSFVEAGSPGNSVTNTNTASTANTTAAATDKTAVAAFNSQVGPGAGPPIRT